MFLFLRFQVALLLGTGLVGPLLSYQHLAFHVHGLPGLCQASGNPQVVELVEEVRSVRSQYSQPDCTAF